METRVAPLLAGALSLLLVTLGGCRQAHEGWEPPVEETSTRLLQQEAEKALHRVESARNALEENEEQAAERLAEASRALERLSRYYLPLLEAKERVYNAHRFVYYGETGRAEAEINRVQRILNGVVEAGGERLFKVLTPALDLVGEAKAAIRGAPEEAPHLLRDLAVRLNLASLKGELELPGDWPQESPPTSRP